MILPKTADYIEADFNEAYFTESKYKESRKKHADDISEKISPFKFCIADFLRKKRNFSGRICTRNRII